ncbi:MAG: TonB-dependent receptor, partial [Parvularculaceae bacterium]|nr:TonB-dependent receptor [Parvularculaceae bacterium]
VVDRNGNGRLEPGEVDAVAGAFFGSSNIRQFVDFGVATNPAFTLDTGRGTTRLDPRTIFVAPQDVARARTGTAYADLSWTAASGATLRLAAFYDSMNARLFQSYGFAANYRADLYELRASVETKAEAFGADLDLLAGVSWRSARTRSLQTFLSGYLVVDRRDLSVGPTAGDVFDSPFLETPGGIGWDTDLRSTTTDLAAFAMLKAERGPVALLLGGRADRFAAASINTGRTVFNPAYAGRPFDAALFRGAGEASLTVEVADGARLYATAARNNALETNDGGGVEVERIAERNFVAPSRLVEAGLKVGRKNFACSLAVYRQERTRQDPFGNVDSETSKGVEAEARWLASDRLSFNGAATLQETRVAPPGACGSGVGEFVVLPPRRAGAPDSDGFGGLFAALNASCLPELSAGYKRRTVPRLSASAYATWTAPETAHGAWGATFGARRVGETGGKIAGAVRLPSYTLAKAALFWRRGGVSLTATADNLFDRRYFIPVQNVYEEVGALPGRGREVFITLRAEL